MTYCTREAQAMALDGARGSSLVYTRKCSCSYRTVLPNAYHYVSYEHPGRIYCRRNVTIRDMLSGHTSFNIVIILAPNSFTQRRCLGKAVRISVFDTVYNSPVANSLSRHTLVSLPMTISQMLHGQAGCISGGERRKKPISKSSSEDLSKGIDGGGYQGLHGEHGCKLGIEAEAAGFTEDWVYGFLDRLVDNTLEIISDITSIVFAMLALYMSLDACDQAVV